ncbi:RNA polymerase sigma factor [Enterococcus entomosocium]|uniref:RNA polymerase sigma factor n=1 Tax=Enterococcus entomosocium TaxID=3034352 RepID=UPI003B59DBF9
MNQNFNSVNYEAKIISYIQKTVHNTAINYFVKKNRIKKAELISEQVFLDYLIEEQLILSKENVILEYENFLLNFFNFDLATEFQKLSGVDQSLLIRKYILGYSDYEISLQLSMTRQGVTKKRQRILEKIRKRLIHQF